MCKKYFKQTRIRSDPPAVRVAPHVDACVSAERLRHDAFARQFGDLTAAEAKSLLAQRSALAELRRMRVGRTLASSDDVSIALSCTVQAAMAYAPTAEGVLANAAILCKVLAGNSDAALRLAPLANRLKACELNGPAKFSLVYELAQANVKADSHWSMSSHKPTSRPSTRRRLSLPGASRACRSTTSWLMPGRGRLTLGSIIRS